MERVKMAAEKLEKAVGEMNEAEQRFMCQFDTIEQLYFEKEKMYLEKMSEAEERHTKELKEQRDRDLKVMLVLAAIIFLIIGSIIGVITYITSNFDFRFLPSYSQSVSAEGGGDATNEDGIHVDFYDHPIE